MIFTSGGFFHNEEMRTQYLRGTVWGVTAPYTNTGVLMNVATDLGAMIENTDSLWWGEMGIDDVLDSHRSDNMAFWLWGDSMVLVNRRGLRVVNEKAHYNERGRAHTIYDATTKQYENNILIQVYDEAVASNPEMGVKYPVPYPGMPTDHVLVGNTFEELAEAIDAKLATLAHRTGGVRLADGFAQQLRETVERFNKFAENGVDDDFGRGTAPGERGYSVLGLSRGTKNRTMYPFADTGPYYAVLLGAGGFDTNGGPSINEKAQIIDRHEQPIPGLYGAGNCIGAPGHGAYWSGGATLGNALVWAYHAGRQRGGRAGPLSRRGLSAVDQRFAGKVVLVTGGARGQGAAEAERFAAEGATVIAGDVHETAEVADGIQLHPARRDVAGALGRGGRPDRRRSRPPRRARQQRRHRHLGDAGDASARATGARCWRSTSTARCTACRSALRRCATAVAARSSTRPRARPSTASPSRPTTRASGRCAD